MTDNPYQSPHTKSDDAKRSEAGPTQAHQPRKSAVLAIAFGWNLPIVANFYLHWRGVISDRTSDVLMASWAATIPIFVLIFAYSPRVHRWILNHPIDRPKRSAAWVMAGFWAILSGYWLYEVLTGS